MDRPHFHIKGGPLHKLPEVEQSSLPNGLDVGESSVLALCLERGWVPAIDEKSGRAVARKLGVKPTGTIGPAPNLGFTGGLKLDMETHSS